MELSEVQADGIESANQLTKKSIAVKLIKSEITTNRNQSAAFVVINMFWERIIVLPMERNVANVRNGIISRPVATRNEKGRNETNS